MERCLVITLQIRDLALKLLGETPASIANLIGLWQEKNNKGFEEYPEVAELNKFRALLKKASSDLINIDAEENKDLSTLANRPFIYPSFISDEVVKYNTVEGAFLAAKLKYADMPAVQKESINVQLMEATGTQAKSMGEKILNLNIELWNLDSSDILLSLIKTSFELNPEALQRLKDTDNKILISTQDNNGLVLMRVRDELFNTTYGAFDTSLTVSLEELERVNLDFDPITRVDRVSLIARFFSNEITSLLEEQLEAIKNRLNTTQNEIERYELLEELESLSRRVIIDRYGPEGIFGRVKKRYFDNYIESSEAERTDAEFRKLVQDASIVQDYTEGELKEYALELAAENLDKFLKVSNNFKALAEEASSILLHSEGLKITFGEATLNADYSEENVDPLEDDSEDLGTNIGKEELVKDGWMIKYLHVSGHESLSLDVRKVINSIPRIDREGYVETDDLGFDRYLDSSYVVATLMDGLKGMLNPDDMIPTILKLSKNKPWLEGLILKLLNDERLFSQFYLNFRKVFMPYTVVRSILMPDGKLQFKTVSINSPEGVYYLIDAWRDNYESGSLLTSNSVYNKDGTINKDKIDNNYNTLLELTNKINTLDTLLKLELIDSDNEIFKTLVDLLQSIGIQPNIDVLITALKDVESVKEINITDPIDRMLESLNVILKGLKDNKTIVKDDVVDLINTFGGAYNSIALMLAHVTEDAIESSVHQNGKSYYSHVLPAYIDKIISNLKNTYKDEERFLEFIEKEFKLYSFFYKNGKWLNGWIEELVTNPNSRNLLNHDMVLSYNNKTYKSFDSLDYALILLERYNLQDKVDKGNAWYYVPIMSDTESAEFIHFKKYRTGDELDENANKRHFSDIIIDKMSNIVLLEFDRIKMVIARDEARVLGDPKVLEITNLDIVRNKDGSIKSIGGAEFKFLPGLNTIIDEQGNTFLDMLGVKSQNNDPDLRLFILDNLRLVMEDNFETAYNKWELIGLLDKTENGDYRYLPYRTEANAKEALKEYFYNSSYATSLIELLLITDLSQYKNAKDFLKRFKEVHAPSLRLNTKSKYGRKFERTVYLKDIIKPSDFIDDIKEILLLRVDLNLMSKIDLDYIISQYKKVNVADALAYRSMDSYRSIMDMLGRWTDDMEKTYLRFKNNEWTLEDFQTLWQPIKPFVYTLIQKDSDVDSYGSIKLGVQHKNSEYLLMAMNELIGGNLHSSPKLRAIAAFMEKADLDVVLFESAVKVGLLGAVDLNGLLTYDEVYNTLLEATHVNGLDNPNVIHTIPFEDYGIQILTPEHSIDAVLGIGTLLRKLITSDMADDIKITVGDMILSKKKWLELYNRITTENIILLFLDINDSFKDPKKIEKLLKELINSSPRYGRDLLLACTLDENNNFNIPLFDPVQSGRVQQLINSVLKSRITKLKTKGGSLMQLSNYGFTDELNIVYEGKGKNKRIKYFECYMPWYTKKYFQELIDPNTGMLDINKVPDNLRKLIGYRTPTEDKYSILPLFIKGFLPLLSGGAIMLPEEITTISGGDFDADKLYIMLPEFKVNTIDIKSARRDFINANKGISTLMKGLIGDVEIDKKEEFKEFLKINRDKYKIEPTISKVEYNHSKSPQDNTLALRNNLLIDLMWGVLTNPDTASKMLNPGGFNNIKKAARIVTILLNSSKDELSKTLNIRKGESVVLKLSLISIDELTQISEQYEQTINPLSPITLIELLLLNMAGALMIGIYANHNANHAIALHTSIALNNNGAFTLNSRTLTLLNSIKAEDKSFISKNVAEYLGASVDNVKDPVIKYINGNTFTGDAEMLLARLGYTALEISLLMTQPIVLDITLKYFRESRLGKGKATIINEVIKEYSEKGKLMSNLSYDNFKTNKFLLDDLAEDIMIAKDMKDIKSMHDTDNIRKVEFYKNQASIGYLFSRIMSDGEVLGEFVASTRSDTLDSAAGPTIADTELKLLRIYDFYIDATTNRLFPLSGAVVVDPNMTWEGDLTREKFMNTPVPYLQAFYSLGVKSSERFLGLYFPLFKKDFRNVIDTMRKMTKSGRLDAKTMNSIYNDVFAYSLSKLEFFGGKDITAVEMRKRFINDFPLYFNSVVSSNPEIASLEFIKRLKWLKPNDRNAVPTIQFRNVGHLTSTLKDRYMRDWGSMLYMGKEAQLLALNLFRYSYFKNGFAFGSDSFMHLAPTILRKAIPGYIEHLNQINMIDDNYQHFIDQYIYNHPDNRKLVPEIPQDSSIQFIEKGKPLDTIDVSINSNSSSSDKKILIKETRLSKYIIEYKFAKFIVARNEKDLVYYVLDESINSSYGLAVYNRFEPLGVKKGFILYEYGIDAEDVELAVIENRKYLKDIDSLEVLNANIEDSVDNRLSDELMEIAYADDVLALAASQVYGLLFVSIVKPDIMDETSLENYRDADNKPLC